MKNIVYSDGTGVVRINGMSFELPSAAIERLYRAGVPFWKFRDEELVPAKSVAPVQRERSPRPPNPRGRGATRACIYEVDTPGGPTIEVENVRQFVRIMFGSESAWLYTQALSGATIEGYTFRRIGYRHYSTAEGTYRAPADDPATPLQP